VGWDNIIYGTLLVVFIIFLPQGLVGTLQSKFSRVRAA
jgi:branched-chain amino acid transport system permease protein